MFLLRRNLLFYSNIKLFDKGSAEVHTVRVCKVQGVSGVTTFVSAGSCPNLYALLAYVSLFITL